MATAAVAQNRPRGQNTVRTDSLGVRWEYGERRDPMDDGQEIALVATHNRSLLGLLCMEGLGVKASLISPRWAFPLGMPQTVQVRIDQAAPFEVTMVGDSSDGRRGTVRPDRPGRDLARSLVDARERLVLRNSTGETIVIPISSPRPEAERFRTRCAAIAPALPE